MLRPVRSYGSDNRQECHSATFIIPPLCHSVEKGLRGREETGRPDIAVTLPWAGDDESLDWRLREVG